MGAEAPFEPERIVAALNRAAVRYVIVGGLAVGAHGVVRATRDLDLVPAPDPDNMDALAGCLTSCGAARPIYGPLTGENLARPVALTLATSHGDVQVLNRMAGVPPFGELDSDRIDVEIGPATVAPVCSLAHLRAMKSAARRPRDLVDLAELRELHGD
jgi:hypothetical protein